MHDRLYMCIYSSGLGAFAAWAPGFPAPGKVSRAAKVPSPLEYIHMYSVSCMRWSILANSPIHFGKCACPFHRPRQSILANIRFQGTLDILHFPDTISFFIIFIYSRVWISCGNILWQRFDCTWNLGGVARTVNTTHTWIWGRVGRVWACPGVEGK